MKYDQKIKMIRRKFPVGTRVQMRGFAIRLFKPKRTTGIVTGYCRSNGNSESILIRRGSNKISDGWHYSFWKPAASPEGKG